ncbi:4-carboxymuconolactone decarboxylase [Rhizobium sp. Root73]|uniref:carboxymuconolactone decarboxylase family protein n=1 Tax=unclassified Rhizobium TaxID=2613769 RepID=UPI000726720D|nr:MULTISPECIES: carboxymuconolactone decarboxylase family protein [unclassified Rhizobium]KQY15684.1 4-carboxymuconolactone decarboxylase [Rhizobium sp. Root1334]KRC08771.1 4-carboxymuconolactone decarboxylase [Rhizobium sp. Root73]
MARLSRYPFAAIGTIAVLVLAHPALADTVEERRAKGAAVVSKLNNGVPQNNLENMREEFPFLAEATEAYALGDVWSRPGLDDRTRQLAAVATFAAMGMTDLMTVHARYALNIGVTEDELKEIVYMITVPAGFPRAIVASQALSKLFAERAQATCSVASCDNGAAPTP